MHNLIDVIRHGNEPLALQLIDNGADVNGADVLGGYSTLHHAIEYDLLNVAKLLIEKGANINKFCGDGACTPLGSAAIKGRLPFVKLLLEHGARLDVQENKPWFFEELRGFGEDQIAVMLEAVHR